MMLQLVCIQNSKILSTYHKHHTLRCQVVKRHSEVKNSSSGCCKQHLHSGFTYWFKQYWLKGPMKCHQLWCDQPLQAVSEIGPYDITGGRVYLDVCWIDQSTSLPSGLQQTSYIQVATPTCDVRRGLQRLITLTPGGIICCTAHHDSFKPLKRCLLQWSSKHLHVEVNLIGLVIKRYSPGKW